MMVYTKRILQLHDNVKVLNDPGLIKYQHGIWTSFAQGFLPTLGTPTQPTKSA